MTFARGLAARFALRVRNGAHPARCAAAAAFALAVATPLTALRAQDVAPDRIAKLDNGSQYAITMAIDSANTEGLPGRVLHLKALEGMSKKALEGMSKKADGKQIVAAVRRELIALRVARLQLGDVDDEELVAAAAVVEAGAKPAQLSVFRARVKNRSDLQAFTSWVSLMARGVPIEDASSAISKLWQDGADDATFESLWRNVQSDILRGLNPGTALQNRVREAPSSGRAPPSTGKPPEGQEREGLE